MRPLAVVFATAALAGTAHANPIMTKDGQIMCVEAEAMAEYLRAISSGDLQWRQQVKACFLSLPGYKMAIIERDVPAGGVPRVAKVRIFGKDGLKSDVAYALLEHDQ